MGVDMNSRAGAHKPPIGRRRRPPPYRGGWPRRAAGGRLLDDFVAALQRTLALTRCMTFPLVRLEPELDVPGCDKALGDVSSPKAFADSRRETRWRRAAPRTLDSSQPCRPRPRTLVQDRVKTSSAPATRSSAVSPGREIPGRWHVWPIPRPLLICRHRLDVRGRRPHEDQAASSAPGDRGFRQEAYPGCTPARRLRHPRYLHVDV